MIIRGESRPELLRHETLPEIFAATAHTYAEQVALIDGPVSVTYSELHAAAARVAHHLLTAKVAAPGKIIGLWMSRGADLLIVQLGISMAGAAWLPFDADTPAARVAECAREAGASVVVSEQRLADALIQNAELTVLLAADLRAVVPTTTLRSRSADLTPEHPAYVISTSGTTGKPKAIVISHRAICHFLRSENALLGIGPNDRVYQGFSVAFDMSFEEIWISYLAGAALWLAPSSVTIDPEAVAMALEKQRITVLHAVPSLVALLPTLSPSLRLINLGGEACPQALAQAHTAHRGMLVEDGDYRGIGAPVKLSQSCARTASGQSEGKTAAPPISPALPRRVRRRELARSPVALAAADNRRSKKLRRQCHSAGFRQYTLLTAIGKIEADGIATLRSEQRHRQRYARVWPRPGRFDFCDRIADDLLERQRLIDDAIDE